jgi:hypothetical protein
MRKTTEELLETVFSVWSVLKLYKEDQQDQDSWRKIHPDLGLKSRETVKYGCESHGTWEPRMTVLVRPNSSLPNMTCQDTGK